MHYVPRAVAAAALVLVAFVAACPGPDPQTLVTGASAMGTGAGPNTTSGTGAFNTTSGTGAFNTTGSGQGTPCTNNPDVQCPHTGTSCLNPTCVDGFCSVAPAVPHTDCTNSGGKVCDNSGNCVGCFDATDCTFGDICMATGAAMSACVTGLANGMQCSSDSACGSGHCADSVCCDETCAGVCQACTNLLSGTGPDGMCSPIAKGTDPDKSCTIFCDGAGECLPGKRVFVTKAEYSGTFGNGATPGAKGANALCQAAAQALGGNWFAWTSDSTTSPLAYFSQSTVPYLLLDNPPTMIAANWTQLTSGQLMAPINLDETGAPVSGVVWTGTTTQGVASSNVCLDWKGGPSSLGDIGSTSSTGMAWTQTDQLDCTQEMAHLYCFEQ